MECVFRFPTSVLSRARLGASERRVNKAAPSVAYDSSSPANNNKENYTEPDKRRRAAGKQLCGVRSLFLLSLLIPSLATAAKSAASSSSGWASAKNKVAAGPSSWRVARDGNEKEISAGLAGTRPEEAAGLLAAVGADQHGARVRRQVLAGGPAGPAIKVNQEAAGRLVDGAGSGFSGNEPAASAKTVFDYEPEIASRAVANYEDDDSVPYFLAEPELTFRRLYTQVMEQLEDRAAGGSQTDLFDMNATAAAAAAAAAESQAGQSNGDEPGQGQEAAGPLPVDRRSKLGSGDARLTADGSRPSVTATGTSNGIVAERNKEGQDSRWPGPFVRLKSNSSERPATATKSVYKHANWERSANRTGQGRGGYCIGLKHFATQFEWTCFKLPEVGNSTFADLEPKPTTL